MSRWVQDFTTEDEYCSVITVLSIGTRFTHTCSLLHNHAGDHYDCTTGHRWNVYQHEGAQR